MRKTSPQKIKYLLNESLFLGAFSRHGYIYLTKSAFYKKCKNKCSYEKLNSSQNTYMKNCNSLPLKLSHWFQKDVGNEFVEERKTAKRLTGCFKTLPPIPGPSS